MERTRGEENFQYILGTCGYHYSALYYKNHTEKLPLLPLLGCLSANTVQLVERYFIDSKS